MANELKENPEGAWKTTIKRKYVYEKEENRLWPNKLEIYLSSWGTLASNQISLLLTSVKLGGIFRRCLLLSSYPLDFRTELRFSLVSVSGAKPFRKTPCGNISLNLKKLKYFFSKDISLNVCIKTHLNVYISLHLLRVTEVPPKGKHELKQARRRHAPLQLWGDASVYSTDRS